MKKFLIAIIILIGSFSLVGLIEKLNQTVAYDNLFYIQEIDTYIDVLKDADSSFVFRVFQFLVPKNPKYLKISLKSVAYVNIYRYIYTR